MTIVISILLIAIILIPAMIFSNIWGQKNFKSIQLSLSKLNDTLNLNITIPELKYMPTEFPSLSGNYIDDNLKIYIHSTHKNKSLYIEFSTSQIDFEFSFREQTLLDNAGILAGEKDLETGHKEFDDKFYIESNNPKQCISIFSNEEIREEALKHFHIFNKGLITLSNGRLVYKHYSPVPTLKENDKILLIIVFLHNLKKTLEQ